MREDFEKDDDIRHLPPDIQKAIKEKKEKQKTILMLIILISILAFGIWNNHFKKPKDGDIEQMPVIEPYPYTTPYTQGSVSTAPSAPKDFNDTEVQADMETQEEQADKFIEESVFFDFVRKTMEE